jgi:hypothetical protein
MKVPDYVVPIVGLRFWRWDGSKLKSLNGESWYPRRPLTAQCRLNSQPPDQDCRCGIYALKLDSPFRMPILRGMPTLPRMGALPSMLLFGMRDAPIVAGEVYLWGTVVEHARGWRAQVAYPKSLVVPFAVIPSDVQQAQSWLQAFVAYGVDIFIGEGTRHIPVWTKKEGYNSAGLDYLRKAAARKVEAASTPTRWKGPPGGGSSPPPAVPVHSLVDIVRIVRSRRERWAAQWTLSADGKGQKVCYG